MFLRYEQSFDFLGGGLSWDKGMLQIPSLNGSSMHYNIQSPSIHVVFLASVGRYQLLAVCGIHRVWQLSIDPKRTRKDNSFGDNCFALIFAVSRLCGEQMLLWCGHSVQTCGVILFFKKCLGWGLVCMSNHFNGEELFDVIVLKIRKRSKLNFNHVDSLTYCKCFSFLLIFCFKL